MYIAIDIGATNTRIISFRALSLDSRLKSERFDTAKDFTEGCAGIIAAVRRLSSGSTIQGIGISHVGTIASDKSHVTGAANLPSYERAPLKQNLAEAFTCEVVLENDSICAGLAEYAFGPRQDIRRFAYMTVSTGIGAVFIKKTKRALHVIMSDVGHTMVIGDRRLCMCGQVDCIETYAAGKSFPTRFLKNAEHIDDLRIWEQAVEYLSVAAVNLIVMFQPSSLVFGGGIIENNEYVREKLQAEIVSQLRGTEMPFISISGFKDDIGVYGALALMKLRPDSLL